MKREAVTKAYLSFHKKYPYSSLSRIKKLIGIGKTVLDVGCAAGDLGVLCKGNAFYGIDANTQALQIAKKRYVRVAKIDLNNLKGPLPFGQKFDVIVFADVLEHLLEPEEVVQYFSKYLKPHGRILISVPNIALWRVRLLLLLGKFDYTDYGVMDRTHLHLYTFKTAQELVKKVGLTVVSVRGAANTLGFLVQYMPFVKGLFSIDIIVEAIK